MLTINLDDIISEGNVRVETGDVSSLAASINKHGLLQPLLVVPTSEDADNTTYTLVAGFRRKAALLQLGYTETDAVINTELTAADHVIAAQWAENTERKGLSAFEQSQVAWDLKLEGNKQADVAELMGIEKAQVSKLHKMHKALSSDNLDPRRATQLSGATLFELAEDVNPEAIPDFIRMIVDGEARSVFDAHNKWTREMRAVEFIEAIADDQKAWAAAGINVVTVDPTLTGETVTDQWNRTTPERDTKNRKELRALGFTPEDHMEEPCHVIWIDADGYHPDVSHWCVQADRHRVPTKSKGEPLGPVAPKLVKEAAEKVEASADRKERRLAKLERIAKAGVWLKTRSKAADREEWANDRAIETWRAEHTKMACNVLDLTKERPKGADYNWYDNRLDKWVAETFDGDTLKRDRWKVQFLIAYEYIDQAFGYKGQFSEPIDAVEIPAEPDVEA